MNICSYLLSWFYIFIWSTNKTQSSLSFLLVIKSLLIFKIYFYFNSWVILTTKVWQEEIIKFQAGHIIVQSTLVIERPYDTLHFDHNFVAGILECKTKIFFWRCLSMYSGDLNTSHLNTKLFEVWIFSMLFRWWSEQLMSL